MRSWCALHWVWSHTQYYHPHDGQFFAMATGFVNWLFGWDTTCCCLAKHSLMMRPERHITVWWAHHSESPDSVVFVSHSVFSSTHWCLTWQGSRASKNHTILHWRTYWVCHLRHRVLQLQQHSNMETGVFTIRAFDMQSICKPWNVSQEDFSISHNMIQQAQEKHSLSSSASSENSLFGLQEITWSHHKSCRTASVAHSLVTTCLTWKGVYFWCKCILITAASAQAVPLLRHGIQCVSQCIVWVILKSHPSCWIPLGMLLGKTLSGKRSLLVLSAASLSRYLWDKSCDCMLCIYSTIVGILGYDPHFHHYANDQFCIIFNNFFTILPSISL